MNFLSESRIFLLGVIFSLSGCATSDPALWPPTLEAPTKELFVSLDTWHAMIGFKEAPTVDKKHPDKEVQAQTISHQPVIFEEWGYAERAWYLEGRQGLTGVLRALFWPSQGIVEVGKHNRLWADRTYQPPSDLFKFELSEAGYKRLHTHLETTRTSLTPVKIFPGSKFFQASDSYHVFHHCHQYVASALQEAGLPVSTFWAITRTGLATQLRWAVESISTPEEE